MAAFKILHKVGQCLHARQRHRVIDRGTHAAHYAVAFQCMQTCGKGLFKEQFIQRTVGQLERDVHTGTVSRCHIVTIEAAAVDRTIQQIGFLLIDFVHCRDAALLFQPLEHQTSAGC